MDANKPSSLRKYVGKASEAVIPEGTTQIPNGEFRGLSSLEQITFPSTLTQIGWDAFGGCRNLRSVEIPGSVERIGSGAFGSCSGLVRLTVGKGVKSIGEKCFSYCESLKEVILNDGLEYIEKEAFFNCKSLKSICLPASIRTIGARAFENLGSADIVPRFPDGFFKTRDRIDPSLGTWLPDDAETLAYILAFQTGKQWAGLLRLNTIGREAEVLEQALELLADKAKLENSVAANLVEFALEHADEIGARRLHALRDLVAKGNKRRTKILDGFEEDPRAAKYFASNLVSSNPVAAASTNPVEVQVAKKMKWDAVSLKLKKMIKNGVRYSDSDEVCSPDVLNYIVSAYARIMPERKDVYASDYRKAYSHQVQFFDDADEIAAALDRKELVVTLDEYIGEDLWDNKKRAPEVLYAYARYADDGHATKLVFYINKWIKWQTGHKKGAVIARGALLLNDTKTAMVYLDSIGALGTYAWLRGVNEAVLRDTRLSEFGFDEEGRKVFDLGGFTVTATLADDLTLRLVNDATGKVIKSIPKRGSDPQLYEATQAELTDMKRNIKKVISGRKDELFKDFLYGRTKKATDWESSFIGNPVLRNVARLLVWQQGDQTFAVRGREIVDAFGKPVALSKTYIVLAHPMQMKPSEIAAWQNYLLSEKLRQPFLQMWEPVVDLNAIGSDRYNGIQIRAYLLRNKDKHGIHLKALGFNSDYQIRLDDCSSEVVYHSMLRHAVSQDDWCDVRSIKVARKSRMANHIIGYLDRCALYAGVYLCIADDDVAALEPLLEQLDLAKTIDLLSQASEKGAVKVAARLLDYKDTEFPEAVGVESLEL